MLCIPRLQAMKSCPSCNLKYADDTLQFCLSDGTGLVVYSAEPEEPPTVFASRTKTAERSWINNNEFDTAAPSGSIYAPDTAEIAANPHDSPNPEINSRVESKESASEKSLAQVLSFAPVTIALMQNYWQWLYMAEYNSFQFPALLWNLHFYLWLLLLGGGAALCILALRQNINRGFAIIGLIILSINFLLCLVPRK